MCELSIRFLGHTYLRRSEQPLQRVTPGADPGRPFRSDETTWAALSLSGESDELEALIRSVRFDLLHLGAGPNRARPKDVARLKERYPGLRVIRTIPVIGPEATQTARDFQGVADYLLLDSSDPATRSIGATGQPHDWSVSALIVAAAHAPVILAGGLSPENVRDAIRTVRPWGVDSNTLTSRTDDRLRKDPSRVRRLIEVAHTPL